jgi:pimeloyl-ACP methyl ester carboxylesterase
VTHVERVHGAIASRAFRPASFVGAPARYTHDTIAKVVYSCVRGAGKGMGLAAAELASLVSAAAPAKDGDGQGATPSANANLAQAILNAALGDKLAAAGDPLAIRMAVRSRRRNVRMERSALQQAFPDAIPKIAVFLHGLGETEDSWGGTYGSSLCADFGFSPVYVRYNTGRHISDNGQELARLLTDVVNEWPTPVDELVLVGHSMGGLVVRSACHYGTSSWTSLVTDVFYLGSPHMGAALERLAGKLGWALGRLSETRPYADLVNVRSAGIKDLRYGYVIEEDWAGCDADRCLQNHRHDVDLLETANHYGISASLSGASARVVGDLLVDPTSARGPLPTDQTRHFAGLNHFDLLNHPEVYEAMRSWLQRSPAEHL